MSEKKIVCISTLHRNNAIDILKRTISSIETLPENARLNVTFKIEVLSE
jgi:hypothetical protein